MSEIKWTSDSIFGMTQVTKAFPLIRTLLAFWSAPCIENEAWSWPVWVGVLNTTRSFPDRYTCISLHTCYTKWNCRNINDFVHFAKLFYQWHDNKRLLWLMIHIGCITFIIIYIYMKLLFFKVTRDKLVYFYSHISCSSKSHISKGNTFHHS